MTELPVAEPSMNGAICSARTRRMVSRHPRKVTELLVECGVGACLEGPAYGIDRLVREQLAWLAVVRGSTLHQTPASDASVERMSTSSRAAARPQR